MPKKGEQMGCKIHLKTYLYLGELEKVDEEHYKAPGVLILRKRRRIIGFYQDPNLSFMEGTSRRYRVATIYQLYRNGYISKAEKYELLSKYKKYIIWRLPAKRCIKPKWGAFALQYPQRSLRISERAANFIKQDIAPVYAVIFKNFAKKMDCLYLFRVRQPDQTLEMICCEEAANEKSFLENHACFSEKDILENLKDVLALEPQEILEFELE